MQKNGLLKLLIIQKETITFTLKNVDLRFSEKIYARMVVNHSFKDITKLYGQNYAKKQWKDDMGSGDGYSITYFDKINRYKIEFGFSKIQDNETMSNMSLSTY